MAKLIVTSYLNPDLDGVGCSVGMEELLRSHGREATAVVLGEPSSEARWICQVFGIAMPPDGAAEVASGAPIILVDASDILDMDKALPIASVVEIIDHRPIHSADKFPNAKAVQIELVGSCATLVAERMHNANFTPSKNAARLLYGAIVSNTINYKASVTTDRDRAMGEWLKPIADLPADFVEQMFMAKSDLSGDKLRQALEGDWVLKEFGGKRIGIFQLEIGGVEALISDRREEIVEVMRRAAEQERFEMCFLNAIDIIAGTDTWLVFDEQTQSLLETVFGRTFVDHVSTINEMVMRKQIVPKLKEYLERN